jgi:virulence-associated protein VagC
MDLEKLKQIIRNGNIWEHYVGTQTYEEFMSYGKGGSIEEEVEDYIQNSEIFNDQSEEAKQLIKKALIEELKKWDREVQTDGSYEEEVQGQSEFYKTIGKTGNSLSVLIPSEAKNFGFDYDDEIKITLDNNKILITPVKKKTMYYSRIKGFYRDNAYLFPIWNDTNKSTRFEELDHKFKEGPGGYDRKLYYDHKDREYLLFSCGDYATDKWWGTYISEEDFNALREGADPNEFK